MKQHDESLKTGHLLIFENKNDPATTFSLFFPVQGLQDFENLLKINNGFESCFNGVSGFDGYLLKGYSVNDIDLIKNRFPTIDERKILRLDTGQFIGEQGEFITIFARAVLSWFHDRQSPSLPELRTGSVATGSDFYDREAELARISEKLASGKSILLQSPRRYGKTSLLKRIQHFPPEECTVCFVDLEGGQTLEEFIELILEGLLRSGSVSDCLPAFLADVSPQKMSETELRGFLRKERTRIRKDWRRYGTELFQALNMARKRSVLILDEFSYLIDDIIETDDADSVQELMEWFADQRQKCSRVSFLLAGSENLYTLLGRHDINGGIEDLEPVSLSLFSPEMAASFIFLLCAKQKICVNVVEINRILDLMGEAIPYFLQVFIDLLCSECKKREEISIEDIRLIYERQLLGPESKRYFESILHQLERYNRYKSEGKEGAAKILNRLVEKQAEDQNELRTIWAEHTRSAEKFAEIMDSLKDDFYVSVTNCRVRLASKLISDWWARHCVGFSKE